MSNYAVSVCNMEAERTSRARIGGVQYIYKFVDSQNRLVDQLVRDKVSEDYLRRTQNRRNLEKDVEQLTELFQKQFSPYCYQYNLSRVEEEIFRKCRFDSWLESLESDWRIEGSNLCTKYTIGNSTLCVVNLDCGAPAIPVKCLYEFCEQDPMKYDQISFKVLNSADDSGPIQRQMCTLLSPGLPAHQELVEAGHHKAGTPYIIIGMQKAFNFVKTLKPEKLGIFLDFVEFGNFSIETSTN